VLLVAGALLLAALGAAALGAECRKNAALEPGSGLLHFAGLESSGSLEIPEALGVNPLFTWAELEPREGQYNWRPLDEVIAAAASREKKVAPRLYTNLAEFGQGTPDWVFDAGARSYQFSGGSVRQPIPTDPIFTQRLARFIAELGARYDGNPHIVFFQTNAGMGGYGEMVWGDEEFRGPAGWSPETQIATSRAWIDRWRTAFPSTALVLMTNFIGDNIGETLAAYAVDRGYYLQANNPSQPRQLVGVFQQHAARTKIVLEIENDGCRDATGEAFDALADDVFALGFPIDYLIVCQQTLEDVERAQSLLDRLRK
jgi:hypothetical protein